MVTSGLNPETIDKYQQVSSKKYKLDKLKNTYTFHEMSREMRQISHVVPGSLSSKRVNT